MTTSDDLKTAFGAYIDATDKSLSQLETTQAALASEIDTQTSDVAALKEQVDALAPGNQDILGRVGALESATASTEADIASLKSAIASLESSVAALQPPPVVQPPPTDDPPSGDQPNDPGGDQPPDSPPPEGDAPVIADPDKVFAVVKPSDPMPASDGSNAKVIVIPDEYGTIYVWKMNSPSPLVVDDSHSEYSDSHATGQTLIYNNAATVHFVANPLNPTSGNTTPPPSGTPTPPTPPPPPPPTPTIPDPKANTDLTAAADPKDLTAKITFTDGTFIDFDGATGSDLGDKVVPFANIRQRNVRVTSQDKLWNIDLRPDVGNGRVEAVVKYGNPNVSAVATSLGYTLQVFYKGALIGSQDAPHHFWLARWRWNTSDRVVIQKPSDFFAAKLVPPYKAWDITRSNPPALTPAYTVMGNSGLTVFMGQTGERFEIGQNHEYASGYLINGDDADWWSTLQWAEANGSMPIHIDNLDDSGGILDLDKYATATTYQVGYSKPPIYVQKTDDANKDTFIRPDDAHHPQLSFIAFLRTGDPYYAENMQYQITYYLAGEHNTKGAKGYIFDQAQTRGFAWMMRSVMDCWLAADMIEDPVLRPKDFWKKVLDNNLAYITDNFVNKTDTKAFYFQSGTSSISLGWWQEDYLCGVIGAAVRLGLPEWQPVLDWKMKGVLARINGKSGWNPDFPTLYFAQYVKQQFTAKGGNAGDGNGLIVPLSQRGSQYPYLGKWTLRFTDATTYDILRPDGSTPPGTVTTGTIDPSNDIGSGYVPAHRVISGATPFAAGDEIYWDFTEITTYADLWSYNLQVGTVQDAAPGSLPQAKTDYMYTLFAALCLAAPNSPEASALLPGFMAKMKAGGAQVSYRDSFDMAG